MLPSTSENAQESDPLPVPASTTISPGLTSNLNRIAELSIEYRIWVFLDRVSVMRVLLGLSAYTFWLGLLKAGILCAHGWPTI